MKMKFFLLTSILALLLSTSALHAADNMKAFPEAEEGLVRYVLNLPAQENESHYRVELIVGKTVQVDTQNKYFFGGKIESETIQGWGYTRYLVKEFGPMAGTLMAVDPNAEKTERFIPIGGEPFMIRYNSRLPVVIYVPEGVEVRYRYWVAGPAADVNNG
nr:ecotin family protein [Desulfosediminicola ganghwensis]